MHHRTNAPPLRVMSPSSGDSSCAVPSTAFKTLQASIQCNHHDSSQYLGARVPRCQNSHSVIASSIPV